MPGLDRTGPMGQGSRTGRGLGKCNPQSKKIDKTDSQEKGQKGRGQGRGIRQRLRGGMRRNAVMASVKSVN